MSRINKRNWVAKHAHRTSRSATFVDRKKAAKRGYVKNFNNDYRRFA